MIPEKLLSRMDIADEVNEKVRIRALIAAGDVGAGVTGVLRLYGAEIYGFVVALLEDDAASHEVYARVVVQVTTRLSSCPERFGLRTWLYLLARRELAGHRARASSPPERPEETSVLTPVLVPPLQESSPFRQTSFCGTISMFRKHLTPDEQEVLILRVDRRLSWTAIALTGLGEHANKSSTSELAEERRRVRRKFVEVRQKLTRIAASHGILPGR
jgi:RNA polymerase sigma-70 factor, ECF subfamily